ncbi:MAG: zinc-ribbon domain containing protein [Deltaproteobacteria bacterium]|nr:zinc-ribbon domain containing protein [Deltaproteobacteria bacterium]
MKDKALPCIQCGKPFIVTSMEQEKLSSRGFDIPKRCPDCRKNKSRISGVTEDWEPRGKKRVSRNKKSRFEDKY